MTHDRTRRSAKACSPETPHGQGSKEEQQGSPQAQGGKGQTADLRRFELPYPAEEVKRLGAIAGPPAGARLGSDPPQDLAGFIQSNLPLRPVASVPEIRLYSAGPKSGLWRLADGDPQGFSSPYWAYPWGGGLALARHILDRPQTVAGRRVLDLGAGSGLVAIAAAKAGAKTVIAAEIDRYGVAAIELNAAANGVSLSVTCGDLTIGLPPTVDLILIGDLFYDPILAARVTAFLSRCVDAGIEVLVGDPRRAFLPTDRLRWLADYPVGDFGVSETAPNATASVFQFGPDLGPRAADSPSKANP